MKILHVIDSLNIGGAETLLTNYLLHTKYIKDIKNDLCILYDAKTFLYKKLIDNNINIFNLKLKSKYSISAITKLVRLINQNKYDIVHVHLFPAQYYCSIASYFTGKTKYIFTEHSNFNSRRKYIFFKYLDYLSYARYSKIICVSNMVKYELLKWLPSIEEKTIVIYNGIPLEKKGEVDSFNNRFVYDILFVGSLRSNVKGVDILLKALKLINNKFNKAAIVGDGKLKDKLINLRDKLQLKDKVEFLGFKNNVNELLEKSKLFVLPSRWEGFGLVIIEAMSKAKPIIASNIGGIPEIIEDGKTGILVEPNNEEDLAKAIMKLLNDNGYSRKLGNNAYKEMINKYSIDIYIKNIIQLYSQLLKER